MRHSWENALWLPPNAGSAGVVCLARRLSLSCGHSTRDFAVRLSWNEIRTRAAAFAREWQDAGYEKGEAQSFYNEFFQVFGIRRRSVAAYEKRVERLDGHTGFIDLFWPGVLIVEQKSAGSSLDAADLQAQGYFLALPEKERPRFQLACDFQTFRLTDLERRETIEFPLTELPGQVNKMGFMVGVERREFKDQDPVNAAAAHKMGELHDQLHESRYNPEHLNEYLVRTMFCMFGDDTGIFDKDAVQRIIEERTAEDGSDTGMWLHRVHQALGRPESKRQAKMDEDLQALPHVGGLFDPMREDADGRPMGNLDVADYDAKMRDTLLDASAFDWGKVSPIVFGTMFEDAMDSRKRRGLGAHYTSERNILKVINPLFMDDLRQEFAEAEGRKGTGRTKALADFHENLGRLKFLDPACGCGNFLIVAYKCLRELEVDCIRARRDAMGKEGQKEIASVLSVVDVDQFHGIEIGEFPAKIAEAGLWMMDHVMNNKLSLEFGEHFVRIPIRKHPSIWCADALELEWDRVLPAQDCSFVMGNPPFKGYNSQTEKQSAQIAGLAASAGGGGTKSLDLVAGWFIKGGDYAKRGGASVGLVATNSISQGMQPALLWPLVLERNGLEITAAHQTFPWDNAANVHVVVTQMEAKGKRAQKRLFSQAPDGSVAEQSVGTISRYLTDGAGLANPSVVVARAQAPLNGLPNIKLGTRPIDGGHLLLSDAQRDELLSACPEAKPYCRPFLSGQDFLHGNSRHILWLQDAPPAVLSTPIITRRLRKLRDYRQASANPQTRKMAGVPVPGISPGAPTKPFLAVPRVSSERRDYIPIGHLDPPAVPSDKIYLVQNAGKDVFALLNSRMHNAWVKGVGGRLESRISYSTDLCYNAFPAPPGGRDALKQLEPHADRILAARAVAQAKAPDITLAQMYDPVAMPPQLREAHRALDKAVDRLYRKAPFPDDSARLGHLLAEYEKMAAPTVDAKHEAAQRKAEAKAKQRSSAMKDGAKEVGDANAKRVLSPYAQGKGKQRVRWRAGDAVPGLFARPADSVDPQATETDGATPSSARSKPQADTTPP